MCFGEAADWLRTQTIELTKLQVGDQGPVNIIVSTILEAENILPTLLEYQQGGRDVSVSHYPCSSHSKDADESHRIFPSEIENAFTATKLAFHDLYCSECSSQAKAAVHAPRPLVFSACRRPSNLIIPEIIYFRTSY